MLGVWLFAYINVSLQLDWISSLPKNQKMVFLSILEWVKHSASQSGIFLWDAKFLLSLLLSPLVIQILLRHCALCSFSTFQALYWLNYCYIWTKKCKLCWMNSLYRHFNALLYIHLQGLGRKNCTAFNSCLNLCGFRSTNNGHIVCVHSACPLPLHWVD